MAKKRRRRVRAFDESCESVIVHGVATGSLAVPATLGTLESCRGLFYRCTFALGQAIQSKCASRERALRHRVSCDLLTIIPYRRDALLKYLSHCVSWLANGGSARAYARKGFLSCSPTPL
jgi:hypothetical protein